MFVRVLLFFVRFVCQFITFYLFLFVLTCLCLVVFVFNVLFIVFGQCHEFVAFVCVVALFVLFVCHLSVVTCPCLFQPVLVSCFC